MKLSVLQENLVKGVTAVCRVVRSNDRLPILSHILLKATKEGLFLVATDMELAVTVQLGAKTIEEGVFAVPSRVFGELVSSLPAGRVELSTQKDSLLLLSRGNTARFQGLPAQEFPAIDVEKKESLFSVGERDFQSLGRVVFAAATDESRPVLTGIQFKQEGKRVRLVATDGYRLSLQWLPVTLAQGKARQKGEWVRVIPARAVLEVLQLLKTFKYDGAIQVATAQEANQIVFLFGGVIVVTRLLEGEFPPFEHILPEKGEVEFKTDYEEFSKAVRLAAIFSRENAHIVRFDVKKNQLVLEADSPQVGENVSVVDGQSKGNLMKIAFNSRYLLDFLGVIEGATKEKKQPQIQIELGGALAPGLFTIVGEKDFKHVIMPVRLSEETK